jgi:hypothetical protein
MSKFIRLVFLIAFLQGCAVARDGDANATGNFDFGGILDSLTPRVCITANGWCPYGSGAADKPCKCNYGNFWEQGLTAKQ